MPGRASTIIAADTGTMSTAIASSAHRNERANAARSARAASSDSSLWIAVWIGWAMTP